MKGYDAAGINGEKHILVCGDSCPTKKSWFGPDFNWVEKMGGDALQD